MAAKYDDSDQHGLLMLAALIDGLWRAKTAQDRLAAAAEVRLQGARYGLSPIDRRRLQWQMAETEDKQRRGRHQAAREAEQESPTPALGGGQRPPRDPRAMLRSVPTGEPS